MNDVFAFFFSTENKTTVSPSKAPSSEPTKEPTVEPAAGTTTQAPLKLSKDQLRRLRRQLTLENELSSAMDESENLGIEQVSINYL